MKFYEQHIISIQKQIEKATTHQQDLTGRLFFHYGSYQATGSTYHKEKLEQMVIEVITKVVADNTMDNQVLRGLLLTNIHQKKAIIQLPPDKLTTLHEHIVNRATTWIESETFAGWYSAAIVGKYFSQKADQIPEKTYLQHLVSLWNEIVRLRSDVPFSQSLVFDNNTSLGFEGIAGFLLMMIDIIEKTLNKEMLKKIVREGVRFILSFKREVDFLPHAYSVFPSAITTQHEPTVGPDRLSWSSGDLPQAFLLYQAHSFFQDTQLKKMADLVGLNTLLRKGKEHLLVEGETLYGGSTGIALTYHALFQLSGHQAYHEGYKFWMQQTLSTIDKSLYDNTYRGHEYSVLHGLTGVYLALLTEKTKIEQDWQKILLL